MLETFGTLAQGRLHSGRLSRRVAYVQVLCDFLVKNSQSKLNFLQYFTWSHSVIFKEVNVLHLKMSIYYSSCKCHDKIRTAFRRIYRWSLQVIHKTNGAIVTTILPERLRKWTKSDTVKYLKNLFFCQPHSRVLSCVFTIVRQPKYGRTTKTSALGTDQLLNYCSEQIRCAEFFTITWKIRGSDSG